MVVAARTETNRAGNADVSGTIDCEYQVRMERGHLGSQSIKWQPICSSLRAGDTVRTRVDVMIQGTSRAVLHNVTVTGPKGRDVTFDSGRHYPVNWRFVDGCGNYRIQITVNGKVIHEFRVDVLLLE